MRGIRPHYRYARPKANTKQGELTQVSFLSLVFFNFGRINGKTGILQYFYFIFMLNVNSTPANVILKLILKTIGIKEIWFTIRLS